MCIRDRLKSLYLVYRVRKSAAAAGAEQSNRLAGQIVGIEKGIEDHRHIAPPVRKTYIDHIVLFNAFNAARNCRAGIASLFLLR